MKKVLIVDDSRFVCEEITRLLLPTEFEVVATCRDASAAMESYARLQPDIVLMDIVLPGIDGLEAAEIMLTKWPDAYIVIVTSLAYDNTVAHARKIGAKGLLFKPVEAELLVSTLRGLFEPVTLPE